MTLLAAIPPNQFVSATATHADGSTSEFSLVYAAGGVLDVPIDGLAIQVTPPIYVDLPAQFVAGVNAGTGVSYAWNFGDGQLGSGAAVAHTFATPGNYTVTLSASNNNGSAITSTVVSALEPANINGVIWLDRDADGFFGLGETSVNVLRPASSPPPCKSRPIRSLLPAATAPATTRSSPRKPASTAWKPPIRLFAQSSPTASPHPTR